MTNARNGKYNVAPVAARTIDGIKFDSRAEMARYQDLKLLERAGEIKDLECQVPYKLVEPFQTKDGEKIRGIKYVADFRYLDLRNNRIVVEDVKGCKTDVYRIKKTLLLNKYPEINFFEVPTKGDRR